MASRTEAAIRPLLILLALLLPAGPAAAGAGQPVVLLHGLARSAASMEPMAQVLAREGYAVCNIDYPSRGYDVAGLARDHVAPRVARCFPGETRPIHYVTHSMGGILVRQLAATGEAGPVGRVVMLGPPNQGSEIVDLAGAWPLFGRYGGPAGRELGTGEGSAARRLGPAPFELGVIAGDRSWNGLLSLMIPGPDDGKVAVARTRLEGMQDFLLLQTSHPFMMRRPEAIRQVLHFLEHSRFRHREEALQARRPTLVREGVGPKNAAIISSQYSR
jgi:triacylglycerol lipase